MKPRTAEIPDGYLTTGQVARRLNLSATAVCYAFDHGRLKGRLMGRVRLIEDASDQELARSFPSRNTWAGRPNLDRESPTYMDDLMHRWLEEIDVCAIGVRAVKETA